MGIFGKKDTTEDKKPVAKKNDDKPVVEKKEVKKAVKKEIKKDVKKEEEASMKDLYSEEPAKKTSKSKDDSKKKATKYTDSYRILVRPLITEKATHLSTVGKYAFIVANGANKIEVAKAVEATYGVNVVKVNLLNMKGKTVTRGRIKGKRKDFKKAIVSLKKGQTIKLYEGV